MTPRRAIAIGYDESIGYDPPDEIDDIVSMFAGLIAEGERRKAVPIILTEWPPEPVDAVRTMVALGAAAYFEKPVVVCYRVGVEVPEHIRKLAAHCISFEGDDPLHSTTVVAVLGRYL